MLWENCYCYAVKLHAHLLLAVKVRSAQIPFAYRYWFLSSFIVVFVYMHQARCDGRCRSGYYYDLWMCFSCSLLFEA